MKPVFLFSNTSVTDPFRYAIVGVPHAIASIITRPKGSGQSIGNKTARAWPKNSFFSSSPISPMNSIIHLDRGSAKWLRMSKWGCRHGRTLFAEIRKLGYVGCYSGLAKFLSPWRQPKAETRRAVSAFPDAPQLEATTLTGSRQLSPQVAAALLAKLPAELTNRQAQIVDTLKRKCPGFAVMRKLVFGFRAILRGGKVTTLHRWMEQARKTGIHSLVRFVRTLKQDLSAVEAAVSEPWSNGPARDNLTDSKC